MKNPFSTETEFSKDLFVGRTRELCSALDRLTNPQSRVSSAVYGQVGIGKSWFLKRIEHPYTRIFSKWKGEEPHFFEWKGEGSEITVIPLNCNGIDPWTPKTFWLTVWQQLRSRNIPLTERQIIYSLLDNRVADYVLIGQLLDQVAQNGRFLILLLDNFEWVIKNVDGENPIFLSTMRSLLVRQDKGLGTVLATADPLHDLCKPIDFGGASPFDNVFYPVELKPFNEMETYDFIETRLADTGVRFIEEEKRDLFRMSQGHPNQLRELCYRLFGDKSGRSNV
jgi:hypothetical protein